MDTVVWYWMYAASFLGIAIVVIVGSDVLRKYEYCLTDRKYITHIEETRATFEKLTYRLCRLSIIPSIQVTSRMFHCKESSDGANITSNVTTVASLVVRIDPTIQCYSYQHILRTFLILTPYAWHFWFTFCPIMTEFGTARLIFTMKGAFEAFAISKIRIHFET